MKANSISDSEISLYISAALFSPQSSDSLGGNHTLAGVGSSFEELSLSSGAIKVQEERARQEREGIAGARRGYAGRGAFDSQPKHTHKNKQAHTHKLQTCWPLANSHLLPQIRVETFHTERVQNVWKLRRGCEGTLILFTRPGDCTPLLGSEKSPTV